MAMQQALISLDIGSSGARASAFDCDGRLVADARRGYPTDYPHEGWAQQDARRWFSASIEVLSRMCQRLRPRGWQVLGLALTGQCPTYVPVDDQMQPIGPALTYQDNRAVEQAQELECRFGAATIHERCGHSPQAFYILPKVLWQKEHDERLFRQIRWVLQPSDYLAYRLTGQLATSTTHASGTLAYDIRTRVWSAEFVAAAGLDSGVFPRLVLDPWSVVGELRDDIATQTGLPRGLPIVIGAPDSQCCSLGVGAIEPGQLSNMSGTSTCLNGTVPRPIDDLGVGNYYHVVKHLYSAEVGLNTTGAALGWIGGIVLPHVPEKQRYEVLETTARRSCLGARGVTFVPYLTGGERDSQTVKGGFHNLSMATTSGDLVRAVLEGVAFAERERIELLDKAGCQFTEMYLSGGGARLDFWNQMKADVTGLPVHAVSTVDAAELGAAMLAGIGVGVYEDAWQAVQACRPVSREYTPNSHRALEYDKRYRAFVDLEAVLATDGAQASGAMRK